MDFARKIGKPADKPPAWKKSRIPIVTATDNLVRDDEPLLEDRRLANWRKWLTDRKKLSRRIERVTGRSQADQLHSSSERYRSRVETKELMEHAAIPVPVIPDKYRGGPEFWRTAELLPDRDDASLPEVSLTLTRRQLNLPPDLMRVGLPDLTAKERGLVRSKPELWRRSEYLKTRQLELTEEIALLLPKEPETAALAVKGQMLRKKKQKKKKPPPRIPPISITRPDEEEESCGDIEQTIALKIQGREFLWRRPAKVEATDAETITWSLTFEGKLDQMVEKEIVLENRGTRVILYHWRDSSLRLTGASTRRRGSSFFFNKTKDLVLPGQLARIKVWYKPRAHGISSENWRLVTEPSLSTSAFVFRLWGCAIDTRGSSADRAIDEHLARCVRDSVVRSVVEEVVAGVEHGRRPVEPPYQALFLDSDLFRCLNPCYFYHPSVVTQLREMYGDVAGEDAPPWDLSLNTLRGALLQVGETNRRRDALARFYELCKQCLRSTLYDVDWNDWKSDAVYAVLCAFANLFEAESDFVKSHSFVRAEQPAASPEVGRDPQSPILSPRESSDSSQRMHGATAIEQPQNTQAQSERGTLTLNLQLYEDVFFIRVYKALEEAIERACAIIDSFNRLYQPEK
ncbi:MYCBP-associated protein [Harpegnathos saltator]|uniref:MYCBP-associated protein n=1 Tax=Harpegnathos saltator TaxID=610380 RepID=E2C9P3_HARSA|nr:MYCBP-associated protein [Harpegnathos saltator]EFN75382.1 MYCBP-associated protein [Harpegnathos saltator]